jgi:4-hydroxyphenylpyruvate dioxygenase-like putative hemolysin
MAKVVCQTCEEVYEDSKEGKCPSCGSSAPRIYDFKNSDKYLNDKVLQVKDRRKSLGLEGLVGGLNCVIINTEQANQQDAVKELLRYTGFKFHCAFENSGVRTCVLKNRSSVDLLVTSRMEGDNPFVPFNVFPKSQHLPNTRLETFVFETTDIEKYVSIQKSAGIEFLTDEIIKTDNFSFTQTKPSKYTANSMGFIQWNKNRGNYITEDSRELNWQFHKPAKTHLRNIGKLDHTATRVHAKDRDAAIIEFMSLTNYNFDFAIYVKLFNSITSVARLTKKDFAMVFTSGISPYINNEKSGPTERFIHNYGTRVHHMAFKTAKIEDTFAAIKDDEMDFLIELVGSREEGLKQTFTVASPNTLLVNEYIHRYDDFDGFFTKSNVTLLTAATDKQ